MILPGLGSRKIISTSTFHTSSRLHNCNDLRPQLFDTAFGCDVPVAPPVSWRSSVESVGLSPLSLASPGSPRTSTKSEKDTTMSLLTPLSLLVSFPPLEPHLKPSPTGGASSFSLVKFRAHAVPVVGGPGLCRLDVQFNKEVIIDLSTYYSQHLRSCQSWDLRPRASLMALVA